MTDKQSEFAATGMQQGVKSSQFDISKHNFTHYHCHYNRSLLLLSFISLLSSFMSYYPLLCRCHHDCGQKRVTFQSSKLAPSIQHREADAMLLAQVTPGGF